jgi:hypothetical protein
MAIIQTEFGPVEYSNVPSIARSISKTKCVYSDPPFSKRHEEVKLQPAAVRAFREAEDVYGRKTIDQKRPPRLRRARAIRLTGIGWRDYDYQYSLWRSDSSRYARPWVSAHVQGLAVDVDTSLPDFGNGDGIICRALLSVGWRRVRDDEPWHFSWGVVV